MSDHPPAVELTDADELAHPPGDERLWGESWYFDFTDRDGTLGGYVRLGLYPNLGVAWYWACLVGEGRPLVTVIDHEVALPKAPSLEIRADGLWADHIVETPFDHMTLGCEAFAIAVDDPAEVYGDLRGDRVPFGFDLEWETDRGGLYPWIGTTRYEVSCNVHGEILVGDETIELRRHRPARPQLGRARLVEPRLGVDRRAASRTARASTPRGSACPAWRGSRRATCCRPAAACSRSTCARPSEDARRARVPHQRRDHLRSARAGRGAALLQPGAPRRRGARRHPPRPLPAGAVPLRDAPTADPGVGWTEWNQPRLTADLTGAGGAQYPRRVLALLPDFLDAEHLIETFGLLGIWAIVFAESGLLVGFFLPGRRAPVHRRVPRLRAPRASPRASTCPSCRWSSASGSRPSSATRWATCSASGSGRRSSGDPTPASSSRPTSTRPTSSSRSTGPGRSCSPASCRSSAPSRRSPPACPGWSTAPSCAGTSSAAPSGPGASRFLGYFLGQVDVIEQNLELAILAVVAISCAADRLRAAQGAQGEAAQRGRRRGPRPPRARPRRDGRGGPPPRRPALSRAR